MDRTRQTIPLAQRKKMNAPIPRARTKATIPLTTIWPRCAGVAVRYSRTTRKSENSETRMKKANKATDDIGVIAES